MKQINIKKAKECERILGIDPGVATTGWAVLDFDAAGKPLLVDYGIIETDKAFELSERLYEIGGDLDNLINKFMPGKAGVEELLFCNNAKTAISVGEARGIVLFMLQKNDVPLYEFTPLEVKNMITSFGKASKRQIQETVKLMLEIDELPKPDDAADAIAIAICTYHASHDKILSKL